MQLIKAFIVVLTVIFVYLTFKYEAYTNTSKNIIVLYTKTDIVKPDLKNDCCEYIALENFKNTNIKAKTVILSGHGKPPLYASHTIEEVSKAISSFDPELIVLNSCYGSTDILLDALAKKGLQSMVVAPPFPIYLPGFTYDDNFFNASLSVKERAESVRTEPYYPILKWDINTEDIQEVRKKVQNMSKTELKKNLRRVSPPLVRVKMGSDLEPDSEVLVMVAPERFK